MSPVYASDRLSVSDAIDGREYGTFSGRVQTLFMGRQFDNRADRADELHSNSTAVTINYESPVFLGLSFSGQYVHAFGQFGRGDEEKFGEEDPAYILSNSNFSILNNAYLRYDLEKLGLRESHVTVGRQTLDLGFVTSCNIRQKDQAFEGIAVDIGHFQGLSVNLGVLDKFSSWTSRDDLTSGGLANGFIDIEKVEGVPYSTRGIQFVELIYSDSQRMSLALYDYYGDDLYNTVGANIDYSLNSSDEFSTEVSLKYIGQQGMDRFDKFNRFELESNAFQAGIQLTSDDFSIEPGVFMVAGDGPENDIRSPFQPQLIIEQAMFETDFGFSGGSRSFYVEMSQKWSKSQIYILYLYTDFKAGLLNGRINETDVIYSRNLTENLYVKLKLGLVDYDDDVGNTTLLDYRLFVGYNF